MTLKLIHLPHLEEVVAMTGQSREIPAQPQKLTFTMDAVALEEWKLSGVWRSFFGLLLLLQVF